MIIMVATTWIRVLAVSCLGMFVVSGIGIQEAKQELKDIFRQRDYQRYHHENVVNVSSWSVSQFKARDVCKYMLQLRPKVINSFLFLFCFFYCVISFI